jgi:ectoine hydroxylase-related dioxygenase (phytanoyl-CoA dioxygenase family)
MIAPPSMLNLPWIDSPFFQRELKTSSLSEETKKQVRHFAENGYLIMDTDLPESIFDQIIDLLAPHYNSSRIQDAWAITPLVREVAGCPKILDMLRILYRREPFPFQTLNFREGSQQKTHNDAMHFNSVPQRFMCGVWIAMEDINEYNGPLHYYPGSHKLPFYDLADIGLKASDDVGHYNHYRKYEEFVAELMVVTGQKKEVFKVKKGQALIWAANLFHGGEAILKEGSTRHSQVTHYFFKDCMYYSPIWSDLPIEKMYKRKPRNILTGQTIPTKYLGEELDVTPGIDMFTDYKNNVTKFLKKLKRALPA